MKRYLSFAIVIVALAWPALARAQGSGSTAPDKEKKGSAFSVTRTVNGKVVMMKAGESLVVESGGKRHEFKVASETRMPSDLKEGDEVKVTYRASDSTATEIRRTKSKS